MGIFDFSSIKRSVRNFEQKLDEISKEILELKSKRERILSAPANKDDVKVMLKNWVHASGEGYRQSLRTTLSEFVRNPRNMSPRRLSDLVCVSGAAQPGADSLRPQDVDQALCAIFGPQLINALCEQVEAMEWPEQGLPLTLRTAEADKIFERIAQLEQEYEVLTNEAAEAGIKWRRQ